MTPISKCLFPLATLLASSTVAHSAAPAAAQPAESSRKDLLFSVAAAAEWSAAVVAEVALVVAFERIDPLRSADRRQDRAGVQA